MAIALGSTAINKLWLGTTELKKVFHGDALIYDKTAPVATFPVVEGTNQNATTSVSSSIAVALPASIQAGELLIIFVSANNNAGVTFTTPSGWTQLYNVTGGGNMRRHACYYKVATGSEGASVTLTGSTNATFAANSYRISGYQGTPEAATPATGSSASPNPPSLTPSWGSAKTLWLAVAADISTSGTAPTAPTNFGSGITAQGNTFGANQCRTSSSRRELESTSEDPGTFTIGSSNQWIAATVAIRPA